MQKKQEKEKRSIRKYVIGVTIIAIVIAISIAILVIGDKNYEIEEVNAFHYFRIFENNKYGVINTKGEIVIDAKYDMIYIPNPSKALFVCYTEYAEAEENQKTKILNEKQEEILKEYEQVLPLLFKEKITEVPFEKSVLKYRENGKYGIIDFKGKKITKAIYDTMDSLVYKEGCLIVKQNAKLGIINIKGKEIIKMQYDTITADQYYTETTKYKMAGFVIGNKTQEGYRYGYVNEKGEVYLEPQFNNIHRITEIEEDTVSYLIASKNGQVGVYKNKELVIKHNYEDIEYNKTNKVFLVRKSSKMGVINKEGKEVLKVEFDSIQFSGKIIKATKQGETKIYNAKGEEQNIDYISMIETNNENYFITINQEEKYGVMNKEKQVVLKNNYSYIEYAFGDYFIVTNNEKVGILNKEGKLEVDFSYQTIQKIKGTNILQAIDSTTKIVDFYNSSMQKTYSAKNAVIYTNENGISVLSKEDIKYFNKDGKILSSKEIYLNNMLFASPQEGKWGFVDKEDKVKIDRIYDNVTEFNEYGFAGIEQDGKWGVIDKDAKIIVEPKYNLIDWQNPEFIGKYVKLKIGYGFEYYTDEVIE